MLVVILIFLFPDLKVDKAVKGNEASDNSSSPAVQKYLQVALVTDELAAANHGNQTADFLLVLANIVSSYSEETC